MAKRFDNGWTRPTANPKYRGKLNGLSFWMSELVLEPTSVYNGRRRLYRLLKPFALGYTFPGASSVLRVPAGTVTDFATMPMIATVLLGGRDAVGVMEAAIAHDYACLHKIPAGIANSYLLSVMICMGVRPWKRILIFGAVRWFGYRSMPQRLARFFRKVVGR